MNAHPVNEGQTCERQVLRCGAASLCKAAQQQGATASAVSRRLHVSSRTLRRWRHSPEPVRTVGRPRFQLDRDLRREIRRAVKELGPRTGVETFQARFPHVPRRVLAAVKNHYRRTLLRWRRRQLARLEWTQPGRVWAIDHAEPPLTIDHKYDYVLSVRDLGSGLQLAWEEIRSADADTTVRVLTRLFAEHGPPLVLKSDNGKALTQGGVPALLAEHHVTPLVSPVYRPQYNGSCEAGVKAMKTRTEDAANLADRSRHWTSEDLAHALQIANEHHRRGPHAPSKQQCWQARAPIASEERDTFLLTLAINRGLHQAARPGPLTKQQTKTLERQSVAQTLVELGQLIIHRRPNTTPKKEQKADRIS
jgi:transposase InsO family protein